MSLELRIRQLNAYFDAAAWRYPQRRPLRLEQGGVVGAFRGVRLRSAYAPIVDRRGDPLERQALLQASDRQQRPLAAWTPYALACLDDKAVVYLDRLCRTLHVLNWQAQGAAARLFLDVHPRHIQEVGQEHGQVFARIVRDCGLQPRRIALRLHALERLEPALLRRSLAHFRERGFAMTLTSGWDDPRERLICLLELEPDFIQFEPPRRPLTLGEKAARLVNRISLARRYHSRVLVQGVDSDVLAELAWLAGADGVQGRYADARAAAMGALAVP